jgi:hypothetical protein
VAENHTNQNESDDSDDDTATVSSGPRFNVNLPGGPQLNFTNQSQKVIVLCLTATVLVAVIETVHDNKTGSATSVGDEIAHTLVGGFVAGALLLGMSYFLPEFASGLAIVALAATILDRGTSLGSTLTTITGKKSTSTTPTNPKG